MLCRIVGFLIEAEKQCQWCQKGGKIKISVNITADPDVKDSTAAQVFFLQLLDS